MGTPNAMEVPGPVLAALRDYLRHQQVDAILAVSGPLTAEDREALQRSLEWWQAEYETARDKVKAITARLLDP